MLKKLTEHIKEHKEDFFRYYELHDSFEVSINFIEANADIPVHTHDKDVFNYVFEGEIELTIDGDLKTYRSGEWIYIQGTQPHSVRTKQKVTLLELWKK